MHSIERAPDRLSVDPTITSDMARGRGDAALAIGFFVSIVFTIGVTVQFSLSPVYPTVQGSSSVGLEVVANSGLLPALRVAF